jgi:hypothetical protein
MFASTWQCDRSCPAICRLAMRILPDLALTVLTGGELREARNAHGAAASA